jgi:hypothetical protein
MIKKHKNKIIVIGLLILGILLILFGTVKNKTSKKTESELSCEEYTKMLEEKIEKFLLSVDGIHNVNVIITLDSSSEQVFQSGSSSLSLITGTKEQDNKDARLEIYPYVRGVAIACTNGDNDFIKNKITRLVSTYLGIATNRIEIVSYG